MERECELLLPGVFEVLADSSKSLPDDTSLEKLLDWFSGLGQTGGALLQSCPCLIKFTSSLTTIPTLDPGVLSFALKLTGLLAQTEDGFKVLRENSALSVFSLQHWQGAGLWEDPSTRVGWIAGLKRMMQHQRALAFFVESDFLPHLLHLQTDSSLFVSAAATQTLAHILLTFQVQLPDDGSSQNASADYAAVATATLEHLKASLLLKDTKRTLQGLTLLTQLLDRARPSLQDRLLQTTAGPLETLGSAGDLRVSLAVMDAIMTAQSSADAGHPIISRLLSSTLSVEKPVDLVHVAAAFLTRGRQDLVHSSRAVRVLLCPLDLVTGQTLLDRTDGLLARMSSCLKSKPSCGSVMCVCVSNLPRIAGQPAHFLPCSPAAAVLALVALLRLCVGEVSSGDKDAFRNLLGNARVQKCALEALAQLSGAPGAAEVKVNRVLSVLILYLDHPDSDATVLDKSYKCLVEWMSSSEPLTEGLEEELTRVVRRRMCDQRWEVRDSSLEFLGLRGLRLQLSLAAVLTEALEDPESYVRASAVAALALQQGALSPQEQVEVMTRLLQVLSEDSEGFPRRAVLRFFITGLSSAPSSSSPLLGFVRSVLLLGGADLDWEVKVHTLELTELLLDRFFPVPHALQAYPAPGLQEALESLAQQQVWPVLLAGLLDWDRPVALKACSLLLRLRQALRPLLAGSSPIAAPTCELPGGGWGREVRDLMGIDSPDESVCVNVCDTLPVLGLDQRLTLLTFSSDHVHNSPLSLLQDILTSDPGRPGTTEDQVIVDCY